LSSWENEKAYFHAYLDELKNWIKEETETCNLMEKLAKQENKALEAFLKWALNEKSDELKLGAERFSEKKKEIIGALNSMTENIRGDYLSALEKIAQKVELLRDSLDDLVKVEKKLEKARQKEEKKGYELEGAQASGKSKKIQKKDLELTKIRTEITGIEKDLDALTKKVNELTLDTDKFKFQTLKESLKKLSEHKEKYAEIAKGEPEARQKFIDILPNE